MTSEKSSRYICPARGHWISFNIVDEHADGTPYAGLSFELKDRMGEIYKGTLNDEGGSLIEDIHVGPAILSFQSRYAGDDKFYTDLIDRQHFSLEITAFQQAAEQSPIGPVRDGQTYLAQERAEAEGALFYKTEVRDFVNVTSHLPDADSKQGSRPSPFLKQACHAKPDDPGIALEPNRHHIIEVKALRAYIPLLSRDKAFCALNNYHLSLMAVASYANFNQPRVEGNMLTAKQLPPIPPPYETLGSIADVLQIKLGGGIKPVRFNDTSFHALCEEVPYSKRLEIVPYDPVRYTAENQKNRDIPENVHFLHHEATETQGFITHNDKVVVLTFRGTQEGYDWLRDGDAKQVPFVEGVGEVHRGFYEAFLASKEFISDYMDAFYTGEQTLIICGHSLGGAIGLQAAEWMRRKWTPNTNNILLYTFGSPRCGTRTFVEGASELTHHRIVNHNDPIPGVPFPWLDSDWQQLGAGAMLLPAAGLVAGTAMLISGLMNLDGDPYFHHGEQRHYQPRRPLSKGEQAILWQPTSAVLTDRNCAATSCQIYREDDMQERAKLLKQLLSAKQHSSGDGYCVSALTTLVRWNRNVNLHNGALMSPGEKEDLLAQVEHAQATLKRWQPPSTAKIKADVNMLDKIKFAVVRHYVEKELDRTTDYKKMVEFWREQVDALEIIQARLNTNTFQRLTLTDVFGEFAARPDLDRLVAEWRSIPDISKAERMAMSGNANGRATYA